MGAIEESQRSCLGSSRNPHSEEPTHQASSVLKNLFGPCLHADRECQQSSHIDSPIPIHIGVSPPVLAAEWPEGAEWARDEAPEPLWGLKDDPPLVPFLRRED